MPKRLAISVAGITPGSCFSDAQLAELRRILSVEIPDTEAVASTANISQEQNSLTQLDSAGGIMVAGVLVFGTSITWVAATSTELTFEGWDPRIDPTSNYCSVMLYPVYSSSDGGIEVKGEPSGTQKIRPTMEITEIKGSAIKVKLVNASRDANVYLRLIMSPIPPNKA